MQIRPSLIDMALDYSDKVERIRQKSSDLSPDYLKGRVDQYDESLRRLFDFILGTPAEIAAYKSMIEPQSESESKES